MSCVGNESIIFFVLVDREMSTFDFLLVMEVLVLGMYNNITKIIYMSSNGVTLIVTFATVISNDDESYNNMDRISK